MSFTALSSKAVSRKICAEAYNPCFWFVTNNWSASTSKLYTKRQHANEKFKINVWLDSPLHFSPTF